ISLSRGHSVSLWARLADDCEALATTRVSRYLPEVPLPMAVTIERALGAAVRAAELVIVATATSGLRETSHAVAAAAPSTPLAWACKGFEASSQLLPHQIVAE